MKKVVRMWKDKDEDLSLSFKIAATPIVAIVDVIDKIKDETGFDVLDNAAINKYAETKEKGKEWDEKHPIGSKFKHLGLGMLNGVIKGTWYNFRK